MAATPATTTPEEPVATRPVPLPRPSVWTMFWSGLGYGLLLLIVGLVSLWYFSGKEDGFVTVDAKRVEYREKVLADRVSDDTKYLHDQPSWFDKSKNLVRVPIQESIDMTIPKLQAVKPHPAYPLSQSLPQPAAAPVFSAQAAGVPAGNGAGNPPASNPTVGQPSPAPVAAAPAPQAPVAKSSPVPVAPATAAPSPEASPAATPAGAKAGGSLPEEPKAGPTPVVGLPAGAAPTPPPMPGTTPFPTETPNTSTTNLPSNNVNNPGNPPIPGTSVQPPPSASPAAAPGASPAGAVAEPKMTPPAPEPSPLGNNNSPSSTPTPAPAEAGATPGGTPR